MGVINGPGATPLCGGGSGGMFSLLFIRGLCSSGDALVRGFFGAFEREPDRRQLAATFLNV